MEKPLGEKQGPRFQRIIRDIEGKIASNDLRPGDVLATRDQLAQEYSVARATVDKALNELARRGLVDSRSGRRTQVLDRTLKPTVASTIGVLWNWPEDQERQGSDYLDLLFRGIREACAQHELEVHFRSGPLHSWKDIVDGKGAQGLLIVRPDYADEMVIEEIHRSGVPVILVPGVLEESSASSISADNQLGIESAVEHLHALGHRNLGLVCLTATVPDHFERLKVFLSSTGKRDIHVHPSWICLDHERAPTLYKERISDWLSRDLYPTAIISCDFMMTLSLMSRLRDLGLRVPEDVSLVTFDDPLAAGQMSPSLTAIAQPIPLLGSRAIERLRELILGCDVPHIDRIATSLVVRDSSAPPSQ